MKPFPFPFRVAVHKQWQVVKVRKKMMTAAEKVANVMFCCSVVWQEYKSVRMCVRARARVCVMCVCVCVVCVNTEVNNINCTHSFVLLLILTLTMLTVRALWVVINIY